MHHGELESTEIYLGERKMASRKVLLDEEEIPEQWYCILPDLPKQIPP